MDRNALLIKRFKSGDKNALDELVKENERLVWSIVNRMPAGEKEDLFQIGCIGLINAAKRFDISKGVMFSTYAVYMIMGEIKKFLRDDGMIKVSRSIKELAVKVKKTEAEISADTGKEVNLIEIAKKLGKTEEEIAECLEAYKKPVSLNKPVGDGKTAFEDIISKNSGFDEGIVDLLSVAQEMKKLKDREKHIIFMRYFKNKTQSEVANELGVSQVHISRLEKKIIENLRKEII